MGIATMKNLGKTLKFIRYKNTKNKKKVKSKFDGLNSNEVWRKGIEGEEMTDLEKVFFFMLSN